MAKKDSTLFDSTNEQPKKEPSLPGNWHELKKKHPEAMLLYRIGDFYQMYKEDAEEGAKILGITLITFKDGIKNVGFPHHAIDTCLPKLIRAGKRVAICDPLPENKDSSPTTSRNDTMLLKEGETPQFENSKDNDMKEETKTATTQQKEAEQPDTLDLDKEFEAICRLCEKFGDKVADTLDKLHADYEKSHARWMEDKSDSRHLADITYEISRLAKVYNSIIDISGRIAGYWVD